MGAVGGAIATAVEVLSCQSERQQCLLWPVAVVDASDALLLLLYHQYRYQQRHQRQQVMGIRRYHHPL